MILRLATANENHWEREGTTEVVPSRIHESRTLFSKGRPSAATKDLTAEVQDVRKNRSAGVSPAWEAGQLLFASTAPYLAGWKPALHFLPRPRRKTARGKSFQPGKNFTLHSIGDREYTETHGEP